MYGSQDCEPHSGAGRALHLHRLMLLWDNNRIGDDITSHFSLRLSCFTFIFTSGNPLDMEFTGSHVALIKGGKGL